MASKCPNCGHPLTCGCQKKVSLSGKQCCRYCVEKENQKYRKDQLMIKRKTFLP